MNLMAINRENSVQMSSVCGNALPSVIVPDFDGLIQGPSDQLLLVENQRFDTLRMRSQSPYVFPRVDIPDLDTLIIRTREEMLVVILQRQDPVIVGLELNQISVCPLTPVSLHLETFTVDRLPRSGLPVVLSGELCWVVCR
ncbi:hypothetical protein WICPIJ_000572 [Wickerhamomyces pijperi]|uniref:Uncharacterized protein n=1 Tax=Wickerhamomyces pijperi TaxID=599730 RepID=A0A9P8QCJ6_WICPI|nr:hypothetical protein WICPIJ_000572 [Wickerhamomyces pijperi]